MQNWTAIKRYAIPESFLSNFWGMSKILIKPLFSCFSVALLKVESWLFFHFSAMVDVCRCWNFPGLHKVLCGAFVYSSCRWVSGQRCILRLWCLVCKYLRASEYEERSVPCTTELRYGCFWPWYWTAWRRLWQVGYPQCVVYQLIAKQYVLYGPYCFVTCWTSLNCRDPSICCAVHRAYIQGNMTLQKTI